MTVGGARARWRRGATALGLAALAAVGPSALVAGASAQQLPPLTVPSTTLPPLVTVPPVTLPVEPEVPLPGTDTAVVLPPLTVPTLPAAPAPAPAPA
ncbi:MAG: hypothetical protein M3Q48_17200, partial [Actinomycetota bacterium]|nr:hypothetical protein [Actinomycetota bacterium]